MNSTEKMREGRYLRYFMLGQHSQLLHLWELQRPTGFMTGLAPIALVVPFSSALSEKRISVTSGNSTPCLLYLSGRSASNGSLTGI